MSTAFFITRFLLSLFLLIQNTELLLLKREWSKKCPWRVENLADDVHFLPSAIRSLLQYLWQPGPFQVLIWIRIFAALMLPWLLHWTLMTFLLASTVLILLRWRGAFNGGSDFMSLIVISALFVASLFAESQYVQLGALWYIAVQATASYFLAGWVKIKRQSWRSGRALSDFLRPRALVQSYLLKKIAVNQRLSFLAAWLVLLFELSFPILYWQPNLVMGYLVAGATFHLINIYVFGLNRFFWAWLCTYPAIYYCSHL